MGARKSTQIAQKYNFTMLADLMIPVFTSISREMSLIKAGGLLQQIGEMDWRHFDLGEDSESDQTSAGFWSAPGGVPFIFALHSMPAFCPEDMFSHTCYGIPGNSQKSQQKPEEVKVARKARKGSAVPPFLFCPYPSFDLDRYNGL